jgi:phosphoserine aminotransferase
MAVSAIKEAQLLRNYIMYPQKEQNYNHIPKGYSIPEDADYFHCTSNNTIFWDPNERVQKTTTCMRHESSDIFQEYLIFLKI